MGQNNNKQVIKDALISVRKCHYISNVSEVYFDAESESNFVDINFKINLPSSCKVKGETSKGVKSEETVRFYFSKYFPSVAPEFTLRRDFNQDFPHIQPWLENDCPVPCIYDGDLSEFLLQKGMPYIFEQMAKWLDKAASDSLMDPAQGWEPVRRDILDGFIIADIDFFRSFMEKSQGAHFFAYNSINHEGNSRINGYIYPDEIKKNETSNIEKIFHGKFFHNSVAIVIYPDKKSKNLSDNEKKYIPETVKDFASLLERAELYGYKKKLLSAMDILKKHIPRNIPLIPIPIILMVRRPYNIIGSDSSIELCPYIINTNVDELSANSMDSISVFSVGHRDAVSKKLLMNMSGYSNSSYSPWVLFGAGSLGSKIAIHLARAGKAPEAVFDISTMSPHNLARHAFFLSGIPKANLLSHYINFLAQQTIPQYCDIINFLKSGKRIKDFTSKTPKIIVNTTASFGVREALVSSGKRIKEKLIEASLFANGRIGLITIEGKTRNPNAIDLIAEFYRISYKCSNLSKLIFTEESSMGWQATGQGCGSFTMIMSDGCLSLISASMSEYLLKFSKESISDTNGKILIGILSDDGMGLTWETHEVNKVESISAQTIISDSNNNESWQVRIHQTALEKMENECKEYTSVETGGILLGRVSLASRTFNVVDVIDAPEDSQRSAAKFTIGIKGRKAKEKSINKATQGALHFLGTWHSHLRECGASMMDKKAGIEIASGQGYPSLLLIHKPNGYEALVSYSANVDEG